MVPEEPTLIAGRYAVLRHLGTGGMGTVVLARDERLHREVAIKRVHSGGGADAARRMLREAQLGAGLTHPALVTILDTIVEDTNLIIVMEYVDGETLAARLGKGRLPPEEALAVLRPVAAALDHAHGHGIVHRDVKPANVLLGERGAVKLADLSVALTEDEVSRITRDGSVIGSLPYMAPEQLEPGRATSSADVYALAAIAFEALSGKRAREGRTPLALARAASEGPVPDLRAAAGELPAAAAAVLAAGLAREPEGRPVTAGTLIRDLEVALTPKLAPAPAPAPEPAPTAAPTTREVVPAPPRTERPPPPRTPSRSRRTPALAGLFALLAVAVALVIVLSGGEDDPTTQRADTPTATPSTAETTPEPEEAAATPEVVADSADDDPSTPTGAVRAFYELAAEDDFDASWALAGPELRAVFGGSQAGLEGTLGTLESIRFKTLTAGAEEPGGTPITLETVARHTTYTDRCSGDALAVPDGSGGFLVDSVNVSCGGS